MLPYFKVSLRHATGLSHLSQKNDGHLINENWSTGNIMSAFLVEDHNGYKIAIFSVHSRLACFELCMHLLSVERYRDDRRRRVQSENRAAGL